MPKSKKDCAFGFHLDVHPRDDDKLVTHPAGENYVAEFLDKTRPDYVQIESKGCYGQVVFKSDYGFRKVNAAGETYFDKFIKEAKKRDIALYTQYSTLADPEAILVHPEWAALQEDGTPYTKYGCTRNVSPFSPYVDEELIPHLKQLATEFGFRGIWVDFSNWFNQVDYSDWAKKAWFEKTGIKEPPKHDEEGYSDYLLFNREHYFEMCRHYQEEVRKVAPDFEFCEAQGFTWDMPRKPQAVVPQDFVSIDVALSDYYRQTRAVARLCMNHDVPWDIMSWDQTAGDPAEGYFSMRELSSKPFAEMCMEAAQVIACGGSFEIFNNCWREQFDGYKEVDCTPVADWILEDYGKVGDWIRERAPFSLGAKNIPQTAVYYSNKAAEYNKTKVYDTMNAASVSVRGALCALMETQYSATILIYDSLMEQDLSQYGVIVVPDLYDVEPDAMEKLKEYAKNGGGLILASPNTQKVFGIGGVTCGEIQPPMNHWIIGNDHLGGIYAGVADMTPGEAEVTGWISDIDSMVSPRKPAAAMLGYGKGKVCVFSYDFGSNYWNNRAPGLRQFFKNQTSILYPDPMVQVKGSGFVDVQLMKKEDLTVVHLINTLSTASATVRVYDEVPPIVDLEVSIVWPDSKAEVYLEPGHSAVDYEYKDGKIIVKVDRLHIHSAITVK